MLKKQIVIGKTYGALVSGTVVPVQILGESRYGGWDAKNRVTGRAVRIKGAQRLRYEMENCPPDARGRSWRQVGSGGTYEKAEAALDYTPRSLDEILDALTAR